MKEVFAFVCASALSATWFALAVIVLRLVFRKAPKWIVCALWGIVALRLVVPVTLETGIGIAPDSRKITENIIDTHSQEEQTAPSIGDKMPGHTVTPGKTADPSPVQGTDVITPVTDEAAVPGMAGTLSPSGEEKEPLTPSRSGVTPVLTEEDVGTKVDLASVLSALWLAGAGGMLVYALVSYVLLKKRVATSTRLRDNIYQSENVGSPFILGVFRPKIYLPYATEGRDLEYVVAHERAHLKRKDHLWKPIGFLLLALFWFDPVFWLAFVLFCRDVEGACDEKVIGTLDEPSRKEYSSALLSFSAKRFSISACPVAFGETGVRERVKRVLNYKKPAFWVIILLVVASAAAGVLLLTTRTAGSDNEIGDTETAEIAAETAPGTVPETDDKTASPENPDGGFEIKRTGEDAGYNVLVYGTNGKVVGTLGEYKLLPKVRGGEKTVYVTYDSVTDPLGRKTVAVDRKTGKQTERRSEVLLYSENAVVYCDDFGDQLLQYRISIVRPGKETVCIDEFSAYLSGTNKPFAAALSDDGKTADISYHSYAYDSEVTESFDISSSEPRSLKVTEQKYGITVVYDPNYVDGRTNYFHSATLYFRDSGGKDCGSVRVDWFSGLSLNLKSDGVIEVHHGSGNFFSTFYFDPLTGRLSQEYGMTISYENGLVVLPDFDGNGNHFLTIRSAFDDSYSCRVYDAFPQWVTFGTAMLASISKDRSTVTYSFPPDYEADFITRTVVLPENGGTVDGRNAETDRADETAAAPATDVPDNQVTVQPGGSEGREYVIPPTQSIAPMPSIFRPGAFMAGNFEFTVENGNAEIISFLDRKFSGNVVFPSVICGYKVTKVGEASLVNCTEPVTATLPDTVTEFKGFKCKWLTGVTLPSTLEKLGAYAFRGCDELKSIHFPAALREIGHGAFSSCPGLDHITVDAANPYFYVQGDCLIDKNTNEVVLGTNKSSIPYGVTAIRDEAFMGKVGLTEITVPSTVKKIGVSAFADDESLEKVTLSEGTEIIDGCAFMGCRALKTVAIPSTVTSVGANAFDLCVSLTSVSLGGNTSVVGDYCFYQCVSLVEVTNTGGLKSIGEHAFSNCGVLRVFEYCPELSEIEQWAFRDCKKLERFDFSPKLKKLGQSAFDGCEALTVIELPPSLVEVGPCAFRGCTSVKEIKLREGLKIVGWYSFQYCNGVTEVVIPDSVTEIQSDAFNYCASLVKVVIPSGVQLENTSIFPEGEQLTVYGDAGSSAESYAKSHGNTFALK